MECAWRRFQKKPFEIESLQWNLLGRTPLSLLVTEFMIEVPMDRVELVEVIGQGLDAELLKLFSAVLVENVAFHLLFAHWCTSTSLPLKCHEA